MKGGWNDTSEKGRDVAFGEDFSEMFMAFSKNCVY